MMGHLNKNQFLLGLECPRRMWLTVNHPELVDESKLPSPFLASEGKSVGILAQSMFPSGVLVAPQNFETAKNQTQSVIDMGAKILFEGAFEFDGIRIRCDILEKTGKGWILREVKSSTSPDVYELDVALQAYVLRSLGLKVEPRLMFLDRQSTINSPTFFTDSDVEFTNLVEEAILEIEDFHPIASNVLGSPDEPPPTKTKACKGCEFRHNCFEGVDDHSVLDLYRGGDRIDTFLDQGIEQIQDIPISTLTNEIQIRQVNSVLSGKPFVSENLADALNGVAYPLHFLDFEVAAPAIPMFENQHPYDKLPFQWSCHLLEQEGAELKHKEWLHEDISDPRRGFCQSLLQCLGSAGSIVVYSPFEKSVLSAMAGLFPDLANGIFVIQDRLWDLCAAIRQYFYHPEFRGSFSIKKVLPTLVPGMTYEGMPIADGMAAVAEWNDLIRTPIGNPTRETRGKNLLAYCRQDSLSMTLILHALKDFARNREAMPSHKGAQLTSISD